MDGAEPECRTVMNIEGKGDSGGQFADRRKTKRYVLTTANMVSAQITLESGDIILEQDIIINDVNVDGMRITINDDIPAGTKVFLILNLPEPVSLEARIVWSRNFDDKSFMMGMEFLIRSQVNDNNIPQLLRWAYSYYGKTLLRVNAPVTFEYEYFGEKKSFVAHVIVISPRGIELRNKFSLPENYELTLTFTLNPNSPVISPKGSVLFQQKIKQLFGGDTVEYYQIWIGFIDSEMVENYITAIQKISPMLKY